MQKQVSEMLEKGVQIYSDNTALRAIINAIPYIGGSLDLLISSRGHKIVQERIKSLLVQLQADMSTLKQNMIDRAFLESEEFFDLIVKAFESAARTRDSEKIRMYSRILRNSVIQGNRNMHNPEEYLMVLAELTPCEVELAKAIYTQQGNDNPVEGENELQWARRKGWENLISECRLPEKSLDFLLKRLEGSGLIREIVGTYLGYTGGVYVITDSFRMLMEFLEKDT